MKICSNGHEEIVHSTGDCPLCECKDLLEERAEEVDKLKEKILAMAQGIISRIKNI